MKKELKKIKKIRVASNDLWMSILAIALRTAPDETKAILDQIYGNDLKVASHVRKIIDEDN